jgi:hypothetical protein
MFSLYFRVSKKDPPLTEKSNLNRIIYDLYYRNGYCVKTCYLQNGEKYMGEVKG